MPFPEDVLTPCPHSQLCPSQQLIASRKLPLQAAAMVIDFPRNLMKGARRHQQPLTFSVAAEVLIR